MTNAPKNMIERVRQIQTAWETLRPDKKFAGMTAVEFRAKAQPSLDARTEIEVLESQMTATIDRRENADQVLNDAVQLVVNSVRGDPAEGEDGELYEAMGYVPKSQRRTGLHRAKTDAPAK